ncbi:MAG: protein TolR [Arenicellales bacterium]
MSQTRYGRKKRLMGEINVVPYIDVMLVLLVIFMVTAPLLSSGVKVDLPQAEAEIIPDQDEEPFVVTVDAEGNLYLNDNEDAVVGAEEVQRAAAVVLQRNPKLPFLVRGDRSADYGLVVEAMVLLQRAGVESVGLITETPGT